MKIKFSFYLLKTFFLINLLFSFSASNAQSTIASWTYDSVQGTLTNPTPNFGTGTSSVVNLTSPTTATGFASATGCGNGNSGSAWQNTNFNPGITNEVNGVQFNIATSNFNNIIFSWDQRFSKTSPNSVRLQYTTNGSTWNNFIMSNTNTTICAGAINANGCFETNTGDSYRRIRVDLSSITAINNNANFGIRLLASQYQSTGQYRQSTTPASVATSTGTWRFDNVTFLGTPTTTGAVISGTTSICPSSSANINVTITGGVSPYTVVYTDGTSNFTLNNYISGTAISVSPVNTTTYTLVSAKDNTNTTISPNTGTAIVSVNAGIYPSFTSSAGATSCAGSSVVYTTQSGMDNYTWTFLKDATTAVLGTDYNIIAGSTTTETVTIQWLLSSGTATFSASVTYSTCSGATATSSTVVTIPSITFTSQPGTSACSNTSVTYATQTGQTNYIWTISGVLGTNYSLVSGGTSSDSSLVIKWLINNGTVSVNYTNTSGCTAVSPKTSTTITTLNALPNVTFSSSATATTCSTTSITYTTLANQSNYLWSLPGVSGLDYTITSGGISTTNNTVTLNWLTAGSKVVTVNYNNSNGCSAINPATNTTTVSVPAVITIQPATTAQTTCQGIAFTPITVTASGATGYQWFVTTTTPTTFSPPSGGNPISLATSFSYLPPLSNIIGLNYYYYVQVKSTGCSNIKSSSWTQAYTINPTSIGGTIAGATSLCSGTNNTTLTLSGYTGTITKWQSSSTSDFSSDVVDIPNTTNSLIATNLTSNIYYRAVVTSGACPPAYSSITAITFATTTWNGTSWDNGDPDSTKKVLFASNYSLPNDIQACSLQINPGVVVTVQPNHIFTITNEVIVDQTTSNPASLIFEDGSSLIQTNPNINNISPIYYKRNSMPMKKYDYTYWSSPISNQILNVFSPNTMADKFYKWDTSSNYWSNVAPNSTMNSAVGYIVRAPDVAPFNINTPTVFNAQFYGIPNNGTLTTPIAYSASNDSYNLIGNPYPGALDADAFLNYNKVSSGGVLSGTMYFWTHNTPVTNYSYSYNDYASYNLTGGIASAFAPSNPCSGCNAAVPNGKVGAGQSFFIQGLNNGVATFNNSMRFGVNAQFFKNNTNFSSTENNKNRIWLDLYNNIGLYKQILIGYLPNATNDYDTCFDGPVMDSDNPIMFYSLLNDKKLGIQGRKLPFNVNDEIPIGYKTTVSGNFEIKLSNFDGFFANQEVYLKDTYNNELFNLKNENYSFSTAIGTFEDRFKLLFINTTLSNTAFSSNSNSLAIYQSGNTVNLKSEGTKMREIYVYDIQGRLLNNFKNLNVSEFQFDNPYQKQILVIKIFTTDNNYFYRKI